MACLVSAVLLGLLQAASAASASSFLAKTNVATTDGGKLAGSPPPVVHFMFELKDHLQHPEIWGRFFDGAPKGSHMIWAHCTDHYACEQDYMLKLLKVRLIPTVWSVRGADLVTPFVEMMRAAMEQTIMLAEMGIMEKFVVISDSTLPVKPFAVAHRTLTSSGDSDFCFSTPNQWAHSFFGDEHLTLIKHHQWLALNRTHAEVMVKTWSPVKEIRTWQMPLKVGRFAFQVSTIPRSVFKGGTWYSATDEEAVYAKLYGPLLVPRYGGQMQEQWQLFFKRKCHTYVAFPEDVKPTPQAATPPVSLLQQATEAQMYPVDLTLKLMKDPEAKLQQTSGIWHPFLMESLGDQSLTALRNSPYLFARKFSDCARMPNFTNVVLQE